MNLHGLDKKLDQDSNDTVSINNIKQLSNDELEEVSRAKAFIAQRHELYLKAYKERKKKWFAAHPDRQYFEPTPEEIRTEIEPDIPYEVDMVFYT